MKSFSSFDWRVPGSPPWMSPGSSGKHPASPLEVMYVSHSDHTERRRSPPGPYKASKGKGVHRVPSPVSSLEELDNFGAGSSGGSSSRRGHSSGGGSFKKDEEYQRSKEMEPMEYAWLIEQGFASFVSPIMYTSRVKTTKSSTVSMQHNFTVTDTGRKSIDLGRGLSRGLSKKAKVKTLCSLQHLDLAIGWESSRHVLVEEVISNVLKRAQKSADLSRLQHLGLPPRYLPTIAEAIQAEHLAEFKHLDLANTGSLGEKSLQLRKLVESRLTIFLRSNILP